MHFVLQPGAYYSIPAQGDEADAKLFFQLLEVVSPSKKLVRTTVATEKPKLAPLRVMYQPLDLHQGHQGSQPDTVDVYVFQDALLQDIFAVASWACRVH